MAKMKRKNINKCIKLLIPRKAAITVIIKLETKGPIIFFLRFTWFFFQLNVGDMEMKNPSNKATGVLSRL